MRFSKDMLAGLLFVTIGLGALILAQDFPFGTARRMGAAYFPTMVGALVAAMGGILFVRAALHPDTSEPAVGFALRPVLLIVAAILVFAAMVGSVGLIAAIVAVVILSRLAVRGARPVDVAMTSVTLVVICVVLFVYGLGMPLRLGPWE